MFYWLFSLDCCVQAKLQKLAIGRYVHNCQAVIQIFSSVHFRNKEKHHLPHVVFEVIFFLFKDSFLLRAELKSSHILWKQIKGSSERKKQDRMFMFRKGSLGICAFLDFQQSVMVEHILFEYIFTQNGQLILISKIKTLNIRLKYETVKYTRKLRWCLKSQCRA